MVSIFLEYLYWHFAVAPGEIMKIMRNYTVAVWHRFLIVQHLRTLFAPWHRQNPSDFGKRTVTFGGKLADFLADVYIRLIAATIRLIIIVAGLITEVIVFIFYIILFVAWLAWPVIAIYSVVKGLSML